VSTIMEKIAKKQKQERVEAFENMVFGRLESLWSEIEFLAQIGNIPVTEAEEIMRNSFEYFVAEQAFADGATKEDFLQGMSEIYDEVEKADQEEENDEEEEEDDEEDEANADTEPAPSAEHAANDDTPPAVQALQDALKNAPPISGSSGQQP
jgi:hypothetical protein